MKRMIYEPKSPLTKLLEWVVTLAIIVWLIKLALCYIKKHIRLVIVGIVTVITMIVLYRIYMYRKRNWY